MQLHGELLQFVAGRGGEGVVRDLVADLGRESAVVLEDDQGGAQQVGPARAPAPAVAAWTLYPERTLLGVSAIGPGRPRSRDAPEPHTGAHDVENLRLCLHAGGRHQTIAAHSVPAS